VSVVFIVDMPRVCLHQPPPECCSAGWMEAPPSTPLLFGGKGTVNATIDMGNEAGRTDRHSGAQKKRLGDRRDVLAASGGPLLRGGWSYR